MTKSNPTDAINSIVITILNQYPQIKAIFWTGSVSRGEGKPNSDLDIVVVLPGDQPISKHIRAQYNDWPVDISVNSELEMNNRNYAKNHMIANSKIIYEVEGVGQEYQDLAKGELSKTYKASDKELDILRTKITNKLDDLKDRMNLTDKRSLHEALAIKYSLYDDLTNFYTQDNGKMKSVFNKTRVRDLYEVDKEISDKIYDKFSSGSYQDLHDIACEILHNEFSPYNEWNVAMDMICN